jgi:hypothetical protein
MPIACGRLRPNRRPRPKEQSVIVARTAVTPLAISLPTTATKSGTLTGNLGGVTAPSAAAVTNGAARNTRNERTPCPQYS